ncbi:MAG: helix-turn-helix protein [Parcubacteria group bacterium GW2011_GWC2_49_9]|nr:MAG: helix-turn-helix protein [Parcubacteria group bacterium GW2011_GWC2_49_9]
MYIINIQLAILVREMRKERGWTQEELANKSKCHRTYICMVERARKNATLGMIYKIASAFEIDSNFFLRKLASTKINIVTLRQAGLSSPEYINTYRNQWDDYSRYSRIY